MGKAKRKINRLRRKRLKQKIKPRLPSPPAGYAMRSKMDYNRNDHKTATKQLIDE